MRNILIALGLMTLWHWWRAPTAPMTAQTPAPTPEPEVPKPLGKVAFVIGHNEGAKGAYAPAPMAVHEWTWSNRLAAQMRALAPSYGIELQVVRREHAGSYAREIDQAYAKIDGDVQLIAESHFNAGGGSYGAMLHSGSKAGALLAAHFANQMVDLFGWEVKLRALKRSDRGGRSVWAAKQPTVLLEPGFGDTPAHNQALHAAGPQALAHAYLKAFKSALET